MLTFHQSHWGIDQWVSYLRDKEIPVLSRSQAAMQVLRDEPPEEHERMSPRELTDFVYSDPYLALKLLCNAEHRRSRRLGQETTTALAAVLQLGYDDMVHLVCDSATTDDAQAGANHCVAHAVMSAHIARAWAIYRADVSPDEVTLAALLSDAGELLLWHFAPELPLKAEAELHSGRAQRTLKAQQQALGFTFKQLTLALAQAWELPALIGMLIRGTDTPRANIARLAIDTARHILADTHNAALPSDLVNIHAVVQGATYANLISPLPIPDEDKQLVLAAVEQGQVTKLDDPPVA
jgi:HD-like signal output (HDOD) protein